MDLSRLLHVNGYFMPKCALFRQPVLLLTAVTPISAKVSL